MKNIGMIKNYDGHKGNVVDNDGERYLFTNFNVEKNYKVNNDDIVEFEKEEVNTVETNEKVAQFIKKYPR